MGGWMGKCLKGLAIAACLSACDESRPEPPVDTDGLVLNVHGDSFDGAYGAKFSEAGLESLLNHLACRNPEEKIANLSITPDPQGGGYFSGNCVS